MNKKERVLNCIDGKPIDKTPFVFWHHFHGSYAQGRTNIDAQVQMFSDIGTDFIKVMSDGYFPVDLGPKVETPQDWDRITVPSLNGEWVQGQIDRLKMLREATKDEMCLFYTYFTAYTFLNQHAGRDLCDAHLKNAESRPYIKRALDMVGDYIAEVGAKLITDGKADGLHTCCTNNGGRFTLDEYKLWIRPQDLKALEAANKVSNYNVVHLCGYPGFQNHTDAWKDYPGAVAHWDQHTDKLPIAEAKVIFKNCRALMAGFDNKKSSSVLFHGSKEDIQALTRQYVKAGGKTSFILSSDCTVEDDYFPRERLHWVGEALEEMASGK